MTGLDKAIHKLGNQRRLAIVLGIAPTSLNRWVKKYKGAVPSGRVLEVFHASGITPHELRPDLYPNPTDGLPIENQNTSEKTKGLNNENHSHN